MSRGPGRVMRAALAELADDPDHDVEVHIVAKRAYHDISCACGEFRDCYRFRPTRAQEVAARRALHTLARQGVVELDRRQYAWPYGKPPVLVAADKRCQAGRSSDLATHTDGAP
jgi:hypothetical protein